MDENVLKISALLKEKIMRLTSAPGVYTTNISGLSYARIIESNKNSRCFYVPMILVILQGRKHSILGSEKFSYGENQCLVTGVDLPNVSYVTDVSPEKPLLTISLPIDNYVITQLIREVPPLRYEDISYKGLAIADADSYLLDAFLRLMEIVENPSHQKVMAPMIVREIHYRILVGPLGDQLRMINTFGTRSHNIGQAVEWLKKNYAEPLNIEDLAERVNMASSTFRRHFKSLTTLCPLQYQKRLRLHEAQRLMIMENHTATSAAYSVGYESNTQFNREYKRMFGETPYKDVKKLTAI